MSAGGGGGVFGFSVFAPCGGEASQDEEGNECRAKRRARASNNDNKDEAPKSFRF